MSINLDSYSSSNQQRLPVSQQVVGSGGEVAVELRLLTPTQIKEKSRRRFLNEGLFVDDLPPSTWIRLRRTGLFRDSIEPELHSKFRLILSRVLNSQLINHYLILSAWILNPRQKFRDRSDIAADSETNNAMGRYPLK